MVDHPPLVIDLDGTLIRSDLLIETGLLFLRDQPHLCLRPLQWLKRGKAILKHELAHATDLDVSVLPYDPAVIALIQAERAVGRRIVLATASHRRLAERVAGHLGLFDEVFATDHDCNLSAAVKRDVLVQAYGQHGFDYAGNASDDLPIWAAARQAYVVNAAARIRRQASKASEIAAILPAPRSTVHDWFQALRLHQWMKNLLIFVPLLAAHRTSDLTLVAEAVIAFLCFGLCASGVYLLNDLLDLRDDRHHTRKRLRPFASGRLAIGWGLLLFPLLPVVAVALAFSLLPVGFTIGLTIYYALTLAYSLLLKRRMVIDVITLAALYTLRIVVGAIALDIPLSFWLLAFSMFLFLSLALVKRYAELFHVRSREGEERARGRGYYADDMQIISSLGAASGYMAVMVMALYINDTRTAHLYQHPQVIWLACPLLLTWISRVWILAHRGEMNEDPVIFAVRDRVSLGIGALMGLTFWAAT